MEQLQGKSGAKAHFHGKCRGSQPCRLLSFSFFTSCDADPANDLAQMLRLETLRKFAALLKWREMEVYPKRQRLINDVAPRNCTRACQILTASSPSHRP